AMMTYPSESPLIPVLPLLLGRDTTELAALYDDTVASVRSVVAFAPVRARPQRTYDKVAESREPDGERIPTKFATLERDDPRRWRELVAALVEFGRPAGLFRSLDVERKGNDASDPFQLHVDAFNLIDVGYGVSQILPILAESVLSPRGTLLL